MPQIAQYSWPLPIRRPTWQQGTTGAQGGTPFPLLLGAVPSTLPQVTTPAGTPPFLVNPHDVQERSVFADSDRGTGHRRRRRLYTVAEEIAAVSLLLETAASVAAFESWYQTALVAGTLPFTAAIASETGAGLAYWKAYWEGPPTYDPLPAGKWLVSGSILLVGSPSAVAPASASSTMAVGLPLRGSVAIIVPSSVSAAFGLPLVKSTNLGAVNFGLALIQGASKVPFRQRDWPVPRGRAPIPQAVNQQARALLVPNATQWLAHSTGWTLSNGNKTVTFTSGAGSTDTDSYKSSGKLYFEVLIGGSVNTALPYVPSAGISNSSFAAGGSGSLPGANANGWVLGSDGGIYNNSVTLFTGLGTAAAAQVWMFALDCATKKFWIGRAGTWFNSGDPAAGTGQVATLTGTSWSPVSGMNSGTPALTLRSLTADFTQTVPSGFASWSGG